MLTKKQDYLEKKIEQELMIAKKNGTKNKRGRIYPNPRISVRLFLFAFYYARWLLSDYCEPLPMECVTVSTKG